MRFSAKDGERLMASGVPHIPKKIVVIYLHREPIAFEVETKHAIVPMKAGDYIAYNPNTNEVWPVSAADKDKWYEAIPTQPS